MVHSPNKVPHRMLCPQVRCLLAWKNEAGRAASVLRLEYATIPHFGLGVPSYLFTQRESCHLFHPGVRLTSCKPRILEGNQAGRSLDTCLGEGCMPSSPNVTAKRTHGTSAFWVRLRALCLFACDCCLKLLSTKHTTGDASWLQVRIPFIEPSGWAAT